ncbi:MAG: ATP-binding cassette domain-containing protein [Defluviicoccus sp.]|nr:ATP-binding cassette domain-containing protein [Defluviicoccus sp.]MDG4593111.1 ATP-binding cassette domain-containing protein [Defluviicoccus sp.]MDS4009822.1 ATP-binding cassette domain-containing protein [Defluviicoccus sp.]MDS4072594.1 ATP-binding cassette domain-containing protein [Defluviicoccus sp.]
MSDAGLVLDLAGTTRQLGDAAAGFRLEVPAFRVARGECVALTGPSGCGKSTMLDLLGLVLRPDRADVFRLTFGEGETIDVAALWAGGQRDALAAVRAAHIGYVLQTGGLLPFLTARDNIMLSRALLGIADGDGLIEHLVAALRIGHLMTKKPQALSIGERQRVAIARALAHRPPLLLADEPTAALDPEQAVRVMEVMLALVRAMRLTAIIVSHDWDLVRSLGLREVKAVPLPAAEGAATRFAC